MAILKKKLDKNEWIGMILNVIGIVLIAYAAFNNDKNDNETQHIWIGIISLLAAKIADSFYTLTVEITLFRKYNVSRVYIDVQ